MKKNKIIISTLVVTAALSFLETDIKIVKDSPYVEQTIISEFNDYTQLSQPFESFESSEPFELMYETELEDYDSNESFEVQLDKIIQAKGFDEETKKLIIDSYNIICNNYNNVLDVYIMSDIPSCDEYIQKCFINSIRNHLDKVCIFHESDNINLRFLKFMSIIKTI